MSVEKLVLATISGPLDMVDTAIQRFVINRDFHPINAVEALGRVKVVNPFDANNPYISPLQEACRLLGKLGIAPDYRSFGEENFDISIC